MIVFEASYTNSSHSAQAAYTNEHNICENCQISSREIWTHKTQDKNKQHNTEKWRDEQPEPNNKPGGNPGIHGV